jgi:hypothetical protein
MNPKQERVLRRHCRHRSVQNWNNTLEQDHRAIKKRIRAQQHFRQFGCARRTIQDYEAMQRIRKGQFRWIKKDDVRAQKRFIARHSAWPPEPTAMTSCSSASLSSLQSLQHIRDQSVHVAANTQSKHSGHNSTGIRSRVYRHPSSPLLSCCLGRKQEDGCTEPASSFE